MEKGENHPSGFKKPVTGKRAKVRRETENIWASPVDWNAVHNGQLMGTNGSTRMCPQT